MDASIKPTFLLLVPAVFLAVCCAAAQTGDDSQGSRPGFSLGWRAAYYRPKDADHGDLADGVQARYHFDRRWALEGSLDLRRDRFSGTKVNVVPIQLSVMIYLMPKGYRLAPYILAGGGWYYTHVYAPADKTEFRFGPHAGGGLEYFLNTSWSFDGSYRYLWAEDIHSQDLAHPLGRNFTDKGFMLTAAANYSF
jgi:opacity protein-like surface antigen